MNTRFQRLNWSSMDLRTLFRLSEVHLASISTYLTILGVSLLNIEGSNRVRSSIHHNFVRSVGSILQSGHPSRCFRQISATSSTDFLLWQCFANRDASGNPSSPLIYGERDIRPFPWSLRPCFGNDDSESTTFDGRGYCTEAGQNSALTVCRLERNSWDCLFQSRKIPSRIHQTA